MKHIIFYMIVGCSILAASCVNGRKQTTNYQYKVVSEEKLNGQVEYSFSADSTYVLAFTEKKGTAKQPQNHIDFMVHNLKSGEVVYEESVENGTVSFYNEDELKIVQIPGILKQGHTLDDHTYIVNLKSKEKRPLKDQK